MDIQTRRDELLKPICAALTRIGIRPTAISILGVLAMLACALLVTQHTYILAITLLTVSIVADLLDGSLARYQKTESARGRIVDIIADTSSFALFLLGISMGGLLDSSIAVFIAIFHIAVVTTRTFKAFAHARSTSISLSKLHGFWIMPNVAKAMMYGGFIIAVFTPINPLAPLGTLAIFLLAIRLVTR